MTYTTDENLQMYVDSTSFGKSTYDQKNDTNIFEAVAVGNTVDSKRNTKIVSYDIHKVREHTLVYQYIKLYLICVLSAFKIWNVRKGKDTKRDN